MTVIMWIPVRLPQFVDYHRMKGLDGNPKQQKPLRVSEMFRMSMDKNTTGLSLLNLQQDIFVDVVNLLFVDRKPQSVSVRYWRGPIRGRLPPP